MCVDIAGITTAAEPRFRCGVIRCVAGAGLTTAAEARPRCGVIRCGGVCRERRPHDCIKTRLICGVIRCGGGVCRENKPHDSRAPSQTSSERCALSRSNSRSLSCSLP